MAELLYNCLTWIILVSVWFVWPTLSAFTLMVWLHQDGYTENAERHHVFVVCAVTLGAAVFIGGPIVYGFQEMSDVSAKSHVFLAEFIYSVYFICYGIFGLALLVLFGKYESRYALDDFRRLERTKDLIRSVGDSEYITKQKEQTEHRITHLNDILAAEYPYHDEILGIELTLQKALLREIEKRSERRDKT